jgi:hypothetical protein
MDTETVRTGPRSHSARALRLRRRFLKLILAFIVFCIGAELGALLLFRRVTGVPFYYGELRGARCSRIEQLESKLLGSDPEAGKGGKIQFHPFLGFVHAHQDGVDGLQLTDDSTASQPPLTIGVLGGSVAYHFCRSKALAEVLSKQTSFQGRGVRLVPLAFEGYHQPQQLNALVLYLLEGKHLDCAVSLDGVNETIMGLANLREKRAVVLPDSSMMVRLRAMQNADVAWTTLRHLHRLRSLSERELSVFKAVERFPFRYSPAANLAGHAFASATRRQAASVDERWSQSLKKSHGGAPAPSIEPLATTVATDIAEYWARSVRMVNAICAERGIPYVAFVQPSLILADTKPLTSLEQHLVFECEAEEIATLHAIRKAAVQCQVVGIVAHDLSLMFKDTDDTVYTDFCHLNELGEAILARRIAEAIVLALTPAGEKAEREP